MLIKSALHAFKRAKQYYLTTVFTLAITLSMVLTVFSLVDLVFLAPLPYTQADDLYLLEGGVKTVQAVHRGSGRPNVSNYIEDNNDVFTAFANYHRWTKYKLYDQVDRPEVQGILASHNLFQVLGTKAELGRLFDKTEMLGNKQPSVVLGYRTWQNHYQGDKNIIGKKIQLNQRRFTVIGVAPDDLVLPAYQNINDAVWLPMDMDEVWDIKTSGNWGMGAFKSVVRLKTNMDLDVVGSQLNKLTLAAVELHNPGMLKDYLPFSYVTQFRPAIQGDSADIVFMLLVGVLLLMAIALINLASMQLARAVTKIKTVAISFAFGASNKQLLVESLKHNIAVIGTAVLLALIFTMLSFSLVQTLASDSIARLDSLGLSLNTCLFALLLTAGIALLYSYLELKVVNEENLTACLQSSGKGVGKQMSAGASHVLIGLQVTFSFMVLVAACHVVLFTLSEALRDKGLDAQDKWSLIVNYSQVEGKEQRINIHKSLMNQIEQLNAVNDVKASSESQFPIEHNNNQVFDEQGNFLGQVLQPKVTADYFSNLGLALIGNDFIKGDSELENFPVIINQRLADKISANTAEVVGSKISHDKKTFYTVKGVVANINYPGNETFEYMKVYKPGNYKGQRQYSFLLNANDNGALEEEIKKTLLTVDSRLDMVRLTTLEQQFSILSMKYLSAAWIAITLASISLLMVCIGINGIVNYMVQVRRYDLGVRLAMGADNKRLLKDSLIELMQPVIMSLVFSFSFSFMLLGYSKTLPEFTLAPDWLLVAGIFVGFVLVSLLVSFIPVQQTLTKDPIKALRNE